MPRRTAPRPAPKSQGGSSTGMVIALGAGALLLIGAVVAIVICCNNDDEDASKAKAITCECPGGVAVEGKKCTEASKIMCASCDEPNGFLMDKASKTCKCEAGKEPSKDGKECVKKTEPVTPVKPEPKPEPTPSHAAADARASLLASYMQRRPLSEEVIKTLGFTEAVPNWTPREYKDYKGLLYQHVFNSDIIQGSYAVLKNMKVMTDRLQDFVQPRVADLGLAPGAAAGPLNWQNSEITAAGTTVEAAVDATAARKWMGAPAADSGRYAVKQFKGVQDKYLQTKLAAGFAFELKDATANADGTPASQRSTITYRLTQGAHVAACLDSANNYGDANPMSIKEWILDPYAATSQAFYSADVGSLD